MDKRIRHIKLVAVAGDCRGEEIKLDHLTPEVANYLRLACEWNLECYTGMVDKPLNQKLAADLRDAGNVLIDLEIFRSKYDKRTEWILTDDDEAAVAAAEQEFDDQQN